MERFRELLGRLWRGFLGVMAWPFRILLRITKDGVLFSGLTILCAVVAARSAHKANVPLLIGLVLFSILASSLILGWFSLRNLTLKRRCPERTFAGEGIAVTLTVRNQSRVPVTGLVMTERLRAVTLRSRNGPADESVPKAPSPPPGAQRLMGTSGGQTFAVAVAGRSHERARYSLLVRRRGIYHFGRTQLSTVFPFGFWRTSASRRLADRLVVYPRLGEVDTAFFQEMEVALQRIRRTRPSLEEQDFRGLREYRHGDNPKWIHWRSSARTGKPLVKEFEEPQAKRVLLLLDTNLQRLGTQRFPAFELAISFAATTARELMRRGCEITFFAQGPGRFPAGISVSRERRNLDEIFEYLAGLQPDNSRTLGTLQPYIRRDHLRNVYVLVLGLGSLRLHADLTWLASHENVIKVLDIRGEEFRRIFRRGGQDVHRLGEEDEDLLLALGDDDLEELAREDLALVG